MAATSTPRNGYGTVLAVRGLRAVFVAHAVSMAGTVAAEVALSILIFERTRSALLSALVLVCSFLPYAVSGTVLSSVADRYPARRVLVCCDLISTACIAAMLIPGVSVLVMLGLLVVTGSVAPIFNGARASSLAYLLDPETFPIGRSLLRTISQSTVLAGFAIGGVAVAAVGPTWLLGVDAASFLASATLIRFGTPATPAGSPDGDRSARALLRGSKDGLRYVFAHSTLRRMVLLSWAAPAFASVADGLAVAYTAETGSSAKAAGALFTAFAAGTVVAEVLLARQPAAVRRKVMVPLLLATQLPLLLFVTKPGVPVACALLFVAGTGFAFNQGLDPMILAVTEPAYRGRLFTVQGSGLMTVQGIGIALAGIAGTLFRPNLVVFTAGLVGTVCVAAMARRVVRT